MGLLGFMCAPVAANRASFLPSPIWPADGPHRGRLGGEVLPPPRLFPVQAYRVQKTAKQGTQGVDTPVQKLCEIRTEAVPLQLFTGQAHI